MFSYQRKDQIEIKLYNITSTKCYTNVTQKVSENVRILKFLEKNLSLNFYVLDIVIMIVITIS